MPSISLSTNSGSQIPLKDIKNTVIVREHIAHHTVTQTYFNDETKPLEAFYTFPTPANASVYECVVMFGDKMIKTLIKEKETAKEEYNKAISDGNGAFYMERVNGDVFSVSIGNVQPESEIIITIKYVVELRTEIDHSKLRVNFPLTIMPRYNSYSFMSNESRYQGKLTNPPKVNERPYTMSINGSFAMSDGIVSVDSKTCKMKLSNMKNTSVDFEINDIENLNEDLIVTLERNKPNSSCTIQRAANLQLTNELYRYVTMVNINPSYEDVPEVNPADVHYTILLDKSGSMSGDDIKYCKQGAKIFLLSLPIGSSFDVYQFDDTFEKFKPSGDIEPRLEAIAWIEKIQSGGGTELRQALEDVYKSIKLTGKRGVILLLSDGGISDTADVLKLVKRNKATSVFTIGIGQSVSQDLIQGMADMGNGKAEFVNSGVDQIKEKIHAQLKRAQTTLRKECSSNEVKIDVDGPYKLVPETIPTLYENDLNTFYLFSQNPPRDITYVQTLKDYTLNKNVPFTVIDDDSYPLHRIAGIKLIDSLTNNPSGSQIEHLKQDPHKSTIIETSLNLNVLSNHTSFIGVEYREEKDKSIEQCVLKEVPLQIAKKYTGTNIVYGPTGTICGPCGPTGACGVTGATGACGSSNKRCFSMAACAMPQSFKGINTIGSSLRNATYDLRGQPESMKYVASPWASSKSLNESFECDEEDGCDESMDIDSFSSKPLSKSKQIYTTTVTIDNLPKYIRVGELLTGAAAGLLPFADQLKQNDYVLITGQDSNVDGVYKVWNVGSATEAWVLEKVD